MPGIKRKLANIYIDDDSNVVLASGPTSHTTIGDIVQTGQTTQNGVIKKSVQVSLTAANIIAMGTTPVSLIATPGAGKVIIVDNITFKMTRTATAFTGGGAVEFRYTDAAGAKVTADVAAALVTTGGAGTAFANVRGIEASITPVAAAAIVITNATAAFAAGTGTAVVSIDYHIV
jgi:hypothetical protein